VPSSSQASVADLRVRLLWLTLFRTVATTLVLAGLAVQLSSNARSGLTLSTADLASFGIIGLSYVLTLVTGVLLRAGWVGAGAAWVQIGFDVVVAGAVVFVTGGSVSPFTFLFLVTIIFAAVLLGWRGAVVGFLASASSFLGVLALRPSPAQPFDLFMQLLSQFLVSVLSGYVGEQLSRAGGRLVASEQSLQSLTNLQNEIVSAIPSGLITCGSDGIVTFVNVAGATILGLEPSSVVGVRDVDAVLPSARSQPMGRRWETRVETSRGERTLGLSVAPLTTGGLLIVFQDLTELRRVEAELDRMDHLATLGRLSAQLAHEIRNPLAAMRGSAQLLSGDVAGGPQERLAGVIMREADRLAGLVDGYLKLARPPPPQLIEGRLDQVVLETIELLRADPSFAAVRLEQQLEPVEALCDQAQVKQALLNLLRNAAAAVNPSRGLIRVRVHARDGVPCIDVWDSAGSVRAEDRQRIFEPFFTRARGGTGLGLSTVQTIAQAHGGSISVQSSPEQGTTFSLTLRSSGEPHVAHSGG